MGVEPAEPNESVQSVVRPYNRRRKTIEDAKRWLEKYNRRNSILTIAREERVDPSTVSSWLKKLGLKVRQGQHFVPQPTLEINKDAVLLAEGGPERVTEIVRDRIWGINLTDEGLAQVDRYCQFVKMHEKGIGVVEIADKIGAHRSTILDWRCDRFAPYLFKAALAANRSALPRGRRLLPLHLTSGGNVQLDWMQVPEAPCTYQGVSDVVSQLTPLKSSRSLAAQFGINGELATPLRIELFGYLLGMMVGDAGKKGGRQVRANSMNLDLQLVKSVASNERLGEFACFCCGLLGLVMHRVMDKPPSGAQLVAESPNSAFRWLSERSPLIAWTFRVCMGLEFEELTSVNPVRMGWIFDSPNKFRKRFVQGLADSDGTVRRYTVEIASMPNAEFTTRLLRSIGIGSAYTRFENGEPMRSIMRRTEAAALPIFSEYARGYRYQALVGP